MLEKASASLPTSPKARRATALIDGEEEPHSPARADVPTPIRHVALNDVSDLPFEMDERGGVLMMNVAEMDKEAKVRLKGVPTKHMSPCVPRR